MDEKLQTIYKVTQQIREIVDDECIPLEDLPEAIKDKLREGGAGGSGFTTAFAFSSTNSIAPTSEKMNMSTGLVENLDEGWSQTNTTGADHQYMSYAIFDGWGDIQHTWSSPVDLNGKNGSIGPKGEKGDQGPQGPAGIDGRDGDPGKDGKDGIDGSTYEYVYFRGLTEDDKPINIPSGEGNNQDDYEPTYTKTVTVNGNSVTLKWTDRAQGVDETYKFEWRSERKKNDTNTWSDFTVPILWAKYGEKGKDGDGVQYIFTTTKDFDAPNHPYPTGWETDPEYQNNEADEYIPKPADGQVWKDDPIEVDDINRYCWVSVRKYRNGKWGRYSNPTLWTKWTESSGVITGDVIALDVDPNWVMLNEDENEVKTTVTAYRGSDKVVIQNITCDENGFTFTPEYNESKTEWYLTFSNIEATSSNTYIKLKIALSDDDIRTKTFTIYHTKFSAETVTLDFMDDNILVPCSDGSTPDSGFFSNFLVPMVMRVNGEEKTIVNIVSNNSTYNDLFELVDNGKSLQVKGFPGSGSTNTVDFTAEDADGNSASASLRFTKFNTAGGELVMYTLNVNASDIVADQKNGTYTVYTWQENDRSNIIKVNVNEYSSSNPSKVVNLQDLDSNYKVFYANDPYDWAENELNEEWQIMSDSGLYIGTTDIDGVPGIAPDSCVAFQLRHWMNTNKSIDWENCTEEDYEIQDAEILKVDIIQEVASYKFVIDPTFFHKRVNGTIDPAEIQIGLAKNVAGDNGNPEYIPVNNVPLGYDLYYEINGNRIKIDGEDEQASLPCNIPISTTTGDINLYLVTDENSDDNGKVVLSETIEMRSELPGESAYVGYLTDSLGVVSCDADGKPDTGQPNLTTQFKVTNAKSVTVKKPTVTGCTVSVSGNTITFSGFTDALQPTTVVPITATYTDANNIPAETEAVYTIVKLRNADSTTVLHVSDNNIIVPCDPNLTPRVTKVTTTMEMSHGDEILTINPSTDIQLLNDGAKDFYKFTWNSAGYVDCEFNPIKIPWASEIYELQIKVTGHGEENGENKSWTKIGQIRFVKNVPDEGGKVWNLVLSTKSPKYDITTNKFKQDYISGWINIWEGNDSRRATWKEIDQSHVIDYKSWEELEDDEVKWTVLTENDFETDDEFRIYINPTPGKTVADLDTGLVIRFAYKGDDKKIQEERIEVSKDGQDFSGLELLLSDTAIYQTWKDTVCETVTPNEVRILGIYEFKGDEHQEFTVGSSIKDENIWNQHISGLDVYYTYDIEACSTYNKDKMHPVKDFKQDGKIKNDIVASDIDYKTITNRLDVYLVADYNPHDEEASNKTEKKIIDHKSLEIVPITLPNDAKSYHLELDQDELKVPIDKDGNVDPDFEASIQPYFYIDDDKQTGITFESSFGTTSYGTWAVNKTTFNASDFSGNDTYIWFRPKGYEFYKKCKITKELNPIEIFIDRNVVKREISDNKVHDSITLEAKKWNYDSNTWNSVTVDSVKMNYTTVANSSTKYVSLTASENKYTINLNNNSYEGIDYIQFEIKYGDKTSYEEVGIVIDGRDGSAREVIYYKSAGDSDVPLNPTPKDYSTSNSLYQTEDKELPIDWILDGKNYYNNVGDTQILDTTAEKWVDDYPGVNDSDCKVVYACERKRKYGISLWGEFSNPKVYAMYVKDGTSGENAWSWRLTDPIEMVSYNSDGTPNGTINASTTVLANYGGHVANVQITEVTAGYGNYNGDTFTLNALPADGSDFTIMIKAKGTWDTYTDEAELRYTVKKWFGEPATVQVHLSNANTPITTDSNGNYPDNILRTATLTATSGTSVVNITSVQSQVSGVTATLSGSSLTVTVPTTVTGWSNDVLTVPIVCTLADGYPQQTVTMSFYKVRAAKDAEYPDVYDLVVDPASILVGVNQETGAAVYKDVTVTPKIIKYTASNQTQVLSVSDFNELQKGSIEYSFDGQTANTLTTNTFVINGKNDADEYADVIMKITGGKTQTERVTISHDPLPNIDWELELDCPQDIWYKSDGTTKITDCDNVSCKIYRVVNGVKTYASSDNEYFGFDIHLYLDSNKQDHYTPGTDIGLDRFNKSCKFVLVNPGDTSTNDDVIWDTKEVIKHYQEAGTPGDKGDDSIVTQLTNPSGTVMVVNGEFQSTTSESNLRALKGTEFGNITGVAITKITVNGTPVANDYVSVEHTDDIINPYTEEKLLFTINSSKVDKTKEQTIEVTIQFTAFGKTFTEVKTILVRLAAENSCYLMLTDSNVSVAKDKALLSWDNQVNLTNTLNAVLFDGKTKAQGVEYSATFDSAKVKGSCNSSTGLISITAANPDYDTIEIPVTAKYRGGTYTATLRVSIDVAEWKLKTNLLMINPDHPTDIICSCLMNGEPIFEDLNVSAGWYRYKIDNGTWTSGQNITNNTFTISKDVAEKVTNQMTIEWHSFTVSSGINLLASQTIGILKDGVSGESAVHLELTQDSYNISLSKDSHENISQAVLYNGSTALTSGVTYTSSRASATSEKVTIDTSGNITLDKSTITSTDSTPVNVTITATYNQKPYTKTFTLTKNAWDVWLSIDNVAINADDPKAITGRVMQNSSVFTKSNYYKLYYTLNGTSSEQSITSTDGTFTISLDTVKKATSSLEIYLRDSKGNLYDKESIGVVKNGTDGQNASYLQIEANHELIWKNSNGDVVAPSTSENIKPILYGINGSSKTVLSNVPSGYKLCVQLNGGNVNTISLSNYQGISPESITSSVIFYICKSSITTPSKSNSEDFVEIKVIPTEAGETGSNGPVIYPAGEWTSGTTYTGNIQKAPYVSVTDGDNISYYIAYGSLLAKPDSTNTLVSNVALDWTNPTNKWVKMENYNAIYADIGVLKQALVGKWVFHGDYMFSQNGIWGYYTNNETKYRLYARGSLISGKSSSYSDVNTYTLDVTSMSDSTSITNYTTLVNNMSLWQKIENGVWIPKVCFNAKTGVGHVGSYTDDGVTYKGLQWDESSIKLGNNLKITNDGFIASDNLSNPTSYFKLSEWEAQNGDKSQYLSFQASNKSGFRTDSNNKFGLAVYGTNAYVDNTGHNGALTVIKGDSTYGLFVEGDSHIKGNLDVTGQLTTSDGTYTSSDERLKNFYDEIEVDLDSMSQINKKYFSYKDSDKVQIGVSAQEVQKLYPELVGESGGYLTVAYDKLSVIALKAIDVLHQDNLKLKAEIEELKKLIAQ